MNQSLPFVAALAALPLILTGGCIPIATIEYSGPITPAGVKQVIEALKTGKPYRLRIRSLGGDGEAGIALAETIREYKTPVTIYDYCGSACTAIFIASPQRTSEPNTALLFHWNLRFHSDVFIKRVGLNDPTSKKMQNLAEREARIFNAGRISESLLIDSLRLVEPNCASVENRDGALQPVGGAKLGYVAFKKEQLINYGFRPSEISGIVNSAAELEAKAKGNASWGAVGFVERVDVHSLPLEVPDCTVEQISKIKEHFGVGK